MRLTALFLVVAASLGAEERVFPMANALTPESTQEILTILRTTLQLRDVSMEPGPKVRVGGPDADFGASEWLVHQLDHPVGWQPSEQEVKNPATRDYHGAVRVYYLPADISVQSIQETLTILRTVLDVKKVFHYTQQNALVVADSQPQLEAIDWLLGAMAENVPSAPYKLQPKPDDNLKVFTLAPGAQVGVILTDLRSRLRIQKVFPKTNPVMFVVRGKAAELDAAEKVLGPLK